MRYKELEFFNAAEIEEVQKGMLLLRRYPESIVAQMSVPVFDSAGNPTEMHTGHRAGARSCVGIEARFLSEADKIGFSLFCESSASAFVFSGDFQVAYFTATAGEHFFEAGRSPYLKGVKNTSFNRFSPALWRIVLESSAPVAFRLGECAHAYPRESDLPRKKLLAYGSSITQGCGTPFSSLKYIDVAAAELGWDVKNKAIAGGCFCEKAVKSYLLSEDFDYGYFELGTNIANRPYPIIEERVGSLIDGVCETFPEKKMFFLTPVKAFSDVSANAPEYAEHFEKTRSVIFGHAAKYSNATLLDGHELLDKDYYLSHDVLHPSAFGHVMMGVNLARMLKKSGKI